MFSCVFIFAICIHAVASFPTEQIGTELPLTTKPDGGFSRIFIRDYSIDNDQTASFFTAAVTGIVRYTLFLDNEAGAIGVDVHSIEPAGDDASDILVDILVKYSLQLNDTLLSCSQTTALMNSSIHLFQQSFGNEAEVVDCASGAADGSVDGSSRWKLSLHGTYGIAAGGSVICISVIVVAAVVAKKKYGGPQREYFYIRTQLYDRVLEVVEDEKSPLTPAKSSLLCLPSPNNGKKVARVLVCDQATAAEADREYQEMKADDHQLWYCDKDGFVRSKLADLALEIRGKEIIAASYDPTKEEHRWHFSGDHIVNDHTDNLVVDIRHSEDKNGAELCAYRSHGGVNQKWSREFI